MRQLKKQAAAGPIDPGPRLERLLTEIKDIGGVNVLIGAVNTSEPAKIRELIDQIRRKKSPVAIMLAANEEEKKKVTLIAGLSRDLVERGLDAVKWVKAASAVVEGGGGGRPDMAQAGGKLPNNFQPLWKLPGTKSTRCWGPGDWSMLWKNSREPTARGA